MGMTQRTADPIKQGQLLLEVNTVLQRILAAGHPTVEEEKAFKNIRLSTIRG